MEKSVFIKDLKEGDILQDDIESPSGKILISKGTSLTSNHLYRLEKWFGSSNHIFHIKTTESTKKDNSLEELQKSTITNLQKVYHASGDELASSLSDLTPFLPHIYDDLKTIEDLPDDAISIQYADSSKNHYFRVTRMSIALASIYNQDVPANKRIPLDSICLASLLYDYGRRFRSDAEGLSQLKIDRNAIKGINVDKDLLDGTYKDSLNPLYSYVAFKDKVPEDVRSTILYCNPANSAIKPPANTTSPVMKAAGIISICNTYDALLERVVSHDVSEPVENVLSYMSQLSHNDALDSDLYNLFLRHIPIYTLGTKVELSSGQLAVVIDRTPDFPTKPKVLVLPPNKTEVIDLSQSLNLNIRRIVPERDASTHVIDSLHQEQLKDISIPVTSTQDGADKHIPDSIVLQKGTASEQKPLVQKIKGSLDDDRAK